MTVPPATISALTDRLTATHGMTPAAASDAIDSMTAFLALAARGGTHTPAAATDLAWHEFILRTRDYAAYCARLGGFIHHDPSPAGKCGGASCTNGDCTSGGPP